MWSLGLSGPNFNDENLHIVNGFKNVEIIELNDFHTKAVIFPFYENAVNLRVLRAQFADIPSLVFEAGPALLQLEELSLNRLPPNVVGWQHVSTICPNVETLNISSTHPCFLNGAFKFEKLKNLTLEFSSGPKELKLSGIEQLGNLSLRGGFVNDTLVIRFLECASSLKFLTLTGTQVGDQLVNWVCDNMQLKYLNVADTHITEQKLEYVRSALPKLRLFPKKISADDIPVLKN